MHTRLARVSSYLLSMIFIRFPVLCALQLCHYAQQALLVGERDQPTNTKPNRPNHQPIMRGFLFVPLLVILLALVGPLSIFVGPVEGSEPAHLQAPPTPWDDDAGAGRLSRRPDDPKALPPNDPNLVVTYSLEGFRNVPSVVQTFGYATLRNTVRKLFHSHYFSPPSDK